MARRHRMHAHDRGGYDAMRVGIITGTGTYALEGLERGTPEPVSTRLTTTRVGMAPAASSFSIRPAYWKERDDMAATCRGVYACWP